MNSELSSGRVALSSTFLMRAGTPLAVDPISAQPFVPQGTNALVPSFALNSGRTTKCYITADLAPLAPAAELA